MRELSYQELEFLVSELGEINGFFIDNFYEIESGLFRIRLSKEGVQRNLQVMLPYAINLTAYQRIREEPTGFASAARKRLNGFMVSGLSIYGGDRIIRVDLQKGDAQIGIILEMFGKGNLVIVDGGMKILLAYRQHDFKDRKVRVGEVYVQPRKNQPPKSSHTAAEAPQPAIYRDANCTAVDIGLWPSAKHSGMSEQKFATFQEALDEFCNEMLSMVAPRSDIDRKIEELQASLYQQERLVVQADEEADLDRKAGDIIFRNMAVINEIIDTLKEHRRMTLEELRLAFPSVKVKALDLKEKNVILEMQ